MTTDNVVTVRGLRKTYGLGPGAVTAVDGIDFDIARGEVFALLGPNGAGKSSTVEILEGYHDRSGGTVTVLDADPQHLHGGALRDWKARIGIVLQSPNEQNPLTVRQMLTQVAAFYPAPRAVDDVIAAVGLAEKASSRINKLSGGQRRRVDVALGIVGRPELVFLDEPTTGLDPQARRVTWDLIRELATDGTTVMLTTHYLDEVEALCERVAILLRGRVAAEGAPGDIGGRAHGEAVIEFQAVGPLRGAQLPNVHGAGTPSVGGADGQVRISTATPAAVLRVLLDWAVRLGSYDLPGLTVTRPTLEDVYLRMIASADAANTAPAPGLEHIA